MTTPADPVLYELAERVGRRFLARGWRLATVESCTGGWIAKALTDVAGSSAWVEAGLVTYGNPAKEQLAGVSSATLAREGAVSEAVVREMAAGALERLGVDWHGTTADGGVTVEPVFCLGLCACGPSVMVDGELHGRVDEARMRDLLQAVGA